MTTPISDSAKHYHAEQWHDAIEGMTGFVHTINVINGWFESDRSFSDDIALLHSEVSECFEAYRINNKSGNKDSVQDELADILIRLLDTCDRHDVKLVDQFMKKMSINETRGYRHGGKVV